MTTRFSHRRELLKAKIADLSPMGYLENHGSARDRFETFSAPVSKPPSFPTQIHTVFVTRSSALVSASAGLQRNGKFGAKIWGTKARRRHLSAMGTFPRIATLKL
jgi:hypothetical protein